MGGENWFEQLQARQERVTVNLSGKGDTVSSNLLQTFPNSKTAPKSSVSSTTDQAKRYRNRDAHEVFFRPGGAKRNQPAAKRKKSKPRPLTDKQRAAAARSHWELHHGSKTPSSPKWAAAAPRPDSSSDDDIWAAPANIPTMSPSATPKSPPTTPATISTPPHQHQLSPQ